MAKPEIGIGRLDRPEPLRRLRNRLDRLFGTRTIRAGDVVRREDLSGRTKRLRVRALHARIDRS